MISKAGTPAFRVLAHNHAKMVGAKEFFAYEEIHVVYDDIDIDSRLHSALQSSDDTGTDAYTFC